MKGIKECVNWMLDNPMKVLKQVHTEELTLWHQLRYNHINGCIEVAWCGNETDWRLSNEPFKALNQGTWEEVKEPVDFLTAYKDCLENGNKYIVKGTIDTIATLYNSNGNVMIHTLVHGFTLSNKWIKED